MKQVFIISCFLIASAALAQDAKPLPSRTLIKLSPQHFIANTLQIGTEHFNRDFSKSVNFTFGIRNQGGNDMYDRKIRGGDFDFQFRKYVRPLQPFTSRKNRSYVQGIYFGPFINAGMHKVDNEYTSTWTYSGPAGQTTQSVTLGSRYETQHIAGGFTIGLQRTFWDVVALDVYVGGGLRASNINVISNIENREIYTTVMEPGFSGIFPRIGFKLGVAL